MTLILTLILILNPNPKFVSKYDVTDKKFLYTFLYDGLYPLNWTNFPPKEHPSTAIVICSTLETGLTDFIIFHMNYKFVFDWSPPLSSQLKLCKKQYSLLRYVHYINIVYLPVLGSTQLLHGPEQHFCWPGHT